MNPGTSAAGGVQGARVVSLGAALRAALVWMITRMHDLGAQDVLQQNM